MTMPTDIGAIDLMISFPIADHARDLRLPAAETHDAGSERDGDARRVHVQGHPNHLDQGDDPVDVTLAEMDKWGVDIGPDRRRDAR